MRHAVVSDLTLHGLAYLGVLLVFAGIFGLLVFSWGEVGSGLQPVAELAVPVALLGAGTVLTRRGSVVVGRALTVVGGAVVPLVAIAAVADGSAIPPDAHYSALVAWAAAACFATATVYAVVTSRRPDSPLRFLVAPAMWLGVGMVALAPRADEVIGETVAEPSSGQVAAVLLAVSATAWVARIWPDHRLARPTLIVSVAGLAVFGLLAVVLGAQEAWPVGALVVAAAAVVVGLEAVAPLLPNVVVGVGQVLGAGAAIAAIANETNPGWAAVLGVVAFIAVLEWEGLRRPGDATLLFAGGAVAVALGISVLEPWASVAAFGLGAVWAYLAHLTSREWLPSIVGELVAGILPIGVAIGLFRAIDPGPAAVAIAVVVAAIAVITRIAEVEDPLLRWWVPTTAVIVLTLPLVLSAAATSGWLAATAALGVVAMMVAPLPAPLRIWLSAGGLVEAGAFASLSVGMRPEWSAVVLASAGTIAAVSAHPRMPHAGHVGLVGHLASLSALALATIALDGLRGWAVSVCLTLVLVGLGVTSWYQERGGSPAIELGAGAEDAVGADGDRVRRGVPAVAVAALPATVLSVADSAGVIADDPVRAGVILAFVGAVLAALTWPLKALPRIAEPLEFVGVIAALTGVGLTITEPLPATFAGVLLSTTCLAPHRSVRWTPLAWLGWAGTGLAVVRGADWFGLPAERWCVALLGWASVVVVGSLVADRSIAGARSAIGWVRVGALLAPATLGILAVPIGLMPTYWLDTTTWASSSLAAAAVMVGVAWLTRIGAVSGVAWVLLCVGFGGLAPFDALDRPWIFVGAGFVMVVTSFIIGRFEPRRGWASWDLPPLIVGSGAALAGVAIAVPDAVASTWVAAGALAIAVALWRREPAWAIAGAVLINGAAVDAGRGWLTMSLAATSVAATTGASLTRGTSRVALRLTGVAAGVGAFEVLLVDVGWMSASARLTTAGVMAAALVGGVGLCMLGMSTRLLRLDREWITPWAIGLSLVFAQAGPDLADAERQAAGLAIAVGLLLAAIGSATSAAPLRVDVMREVAVLLAAGSATAAWWAVDAPPEIATALLCAIAVVGTAVWLRLATRPPTAWRRPLALGLALTALGAPNVAWIGDAGTGWLGIGLATLALVATAVACTLPTADPTRTLLQLAGAVSALAAFETLQVRQGWLTSEPAFSASTSAVVASALVGGVLAAGLGAAARWVRLGRDWVIVWGAAATALVFQAALTLEDADRQPGGLALAAALSMVALGAASAAGPLEAGLLRESSAALLLGAASFALWAFDAEPVDIVAAACAVAFAAMGTSLWLGPSRPGTPWLRPLDVIAGTGTLVGLVTATAMLPERSPLVASLLTASAVAAALGVARRVVALQLAVPPLLCAAWLVYASDAVRGEPLWFTVPVGVALLGIAGIGRHRHRRLGGAGTPGPFVAVELAAFGALLLPPIIEMVTDHIAYALVAIALGAALAAWGVVTEVRRRLAAGAIAVAVTVVLLIGVPLVERLADARPTGAAVWLIVLVTGIVAIALAAALERGRATIGRTVEHVGELTRGWE